MNETFTEQHRVEVVKALFFLRKTSAIVNNKRKEITDEGSWKRTKYYTCLSTRFRSSIYVWCRIESPMCLHNDWRGKKHPSAARHSPITRGLNIAHVISRRTLQHAVAPHLRKQTARYTRHITRSCTSGQNGAAAISIMAFHLRFPAAAELSSQLQGNAYQSSHISIKALNPPAPFLATFSTSSFPKVLKPLIAWRDGKIIMLCWRIFLLICAICDTAALKIQWNTPHTQCYFRIGFAVRGNNRIYRLICSSVIKTSHSITCE